MSRIKTQVYAPGSKRITATLRGNVHVDKAIEEAREELAEMVDAAQAALVAPNSEWRVVVSASDDVSNVTEVGGRLSFLPDEESALEPTA
jgi:hypothetical protein